MKFITPALQWHMVLFRCLPTCRRIRKSTYYEQAFRFVNTPGWMLLFLDFGMAGPLTAEMQAVWSMPKPTGFYGVEAWESRAYGGFRQAGRLNISTLHFLALNIHTRHHPTLGQPEPQPVCGFGWRGPVLRPRGDFHPQLHLWSDPEVWALQHLTACESNHKAMSSHPTVALCESQNPWITEGWKRPLRSSSATTNPTPTCLPNHIPKCRIYTFFEPLQGWWLHHCRGQPVPMLDHSFSKEIFPNIQGPGCIFSRPPCKQGGFCESLPSLSRPRLAKPCSCGLSSQGRCSSPDCPGDLPDLTPVCRCPRLKRVSGYFLTSTEERGIITTPLSQSRKGSE